MEKCYVCNGILDVIKDQPYAYSECGLDVILYGITQYKCQNCEETFASLPNIQDLHRCIGYDICSSKKALLKAEEIIFLRKDLHLRAKEMANILGVAPETYSRWENGKKTIGDPHDRLLRSVYMGYAAEKQGCSDLSAINLFKSLPAKRKEIKQPTTITLNPQEWMQNILKPCTC